MSSGNRRFRNDGQQGLLDIDELDSMANISVEPQALFWPSAHGGLPVKNVPQTILSEVAQSTGCQLTVESENNRWNIHGANARKAFEKLEALKSAMVGHW